MIVTYALALPMMLTSPSLLCSAPVHLNMSNCSADSYIDLWGSLNMLLSPTQSSVTLPVISADTHVE